MDGGKQGAWLIAAAFAVYLVTALLTIEGAYLISIAGSVLLFLGIRTLYRVDPGHKPLYIGAFVALVAAFILGRVVDALGVPETESSMMRLVVLVILQEAVFVLAAVLALWATAPTPVRGLLAGAVAAVGIGGWIFYSAIQGLLDGSITTAAYQAQVNVMALLDNVPVLAAGVWQAAVASRPSPAGQPPMASWPERP